MSKDKKYCPLMTIGFNPPEKKDETDMRTCHSDCAWYNESEEECAIVLIADNVLAIREYQEEDTYDYQYIDNEELPI